MYDLLVKLMIATALLQLGISVDRSNRCGDQQCIPNIERHTRNVLHVPWKPISVFPEEATRFK